MPSVSELERRIARLEQRQNQVSLAIGVALAALYVFWQYTYNHWIATYTWMVPFAIGYCAPRIWFAVRITKLDQTRRELVNPSSVQRELPVARVVERPAELQPARPAVAVPAPQPAPKAPGEGPTFLK